MEVRRKELCLKFAKKVSMNPRFAHWFPLREMPDYALRNPGRYHECKPRTERMKRDPVYYMRHELNRV